MSEDRRLRDAISPYFCETCPFWHNPAGNDFGICIYNPPVPMLVGMQQDKPVYTQQGAQARATPIVRAFYPPQAAKDGCGRHPKRLS